jgi:hypothetical protein
VESRWIWETRNPAIHACWDDGTQLINNFAKGTTRQEELSINTQMKAKELSISKKMKAELQREWQLLLEDPAL